MNKPIFINLNHKIENLYKIQPEIYYDVRGETFESFDSQEYEYYTKVKFWYDTISVSQKNTLRGLHGDFVTDKLVQCLKGSIILGVLDIRKDSETFLKQEIFYLNEKNRSQVFIPKGCLNGHYVLEDCIFSYKLSYKYEGADRQITANFNHINWPIKIENPILSERDSKKSYLESKFFDDLISKHYIPR